MALTPASTYVGSGPIAGVQVMLSRPHFLTMDIVGGVLWGQPGETSGTRSHHVPVVLLRFGSGL